MTALMVWPQAGRVAYSEPGRSGTLTMREALRVGHQHTAAGDAATAAQYGRAIARCWPKTPERAS